MKIMSEYNMDYVPDKVERYGTGEDEPELDCGSSYDYDDGYDPEMTREQFSEILAGYEADNAGLKATLLAVCGHYVRTVPGRASRLAWTVAALVKYGFVFVPDLRNPGWYVQ